MVVSMVLALFAVLAVSASAQETDGEAGLFELREHGDAYVRLNRRTGSISYCRVLTDNLVCRLAADERAAYAEAAQDLEERLARAEERIERMESALAEFDIVEPSDEDDPTDDEAGPDLSGELDRAYEFAQRAMRRFFDVVQELREDMESETR